MTNNLKVINELRGEPLAGTLDEVLIEVETALEETFKRNDKRIDELYDLIQQERRALKGARLKAPIRD